MLPGHVLSLCAVTRFRYTNSLKFNRGDVRQESVRHDGPRCDLPCQSRAGFWLRARGFVRRSSRTRWRKGCPTWWTSFHPRTPTAITTVGVGKYVGHSKHLSCNAATSNHFVKCCLPSCPGCRRHDQEYQHFHAEVTVTICGALRRRAVWHVCLDLPCQVPSACPGHRDQDAVERSLNQKNVQTCLCLMIRPCTSHLRAGQT